VPGIKGAVGEHGRLGSPGPHGNPGPQGTSGEKGDAVRRKLYFLLQRMFFSPSTIF
jgi:hypothetical protein